MINNKLPKDAQMVSITNWKITDPLFEWNDWNEEKQQIYNKSRINSLWAP